MLNMLPIKYEEEQVRFALIVQRRERMLLSLSSLFITRYKIINYSLYSFVYGSLAVL